MSRTILVVDDDNTITSALSILIKHILKYNVIQSNDPYSALELEELQDNSVDMIITDFMMPGMNGLEFLKSAKEKCPDAVAIMLTGYADKENAIKSINELELYYYMEKPWDNNSLIKVIQNGLEKKRLSEELKEKIIQLENSNKEVGRLYKLLEKDYHQEVNKNELLGQMVTIKTSAVRNLLNNAGQGFLTFGEDLLVEDEYSLECENLFRKDIKGKKITDLIKDHNNESFQPLVEDAFRRILTDSDGKSTDLFLPLLPERVIAGGKPVSIEFKVISDPLEKTGRKMMVILTDTSEKDRLLKQAENEKTSLKMIVKFITCFNDFDDLLNDSRYFTNIEINDILNSSKSVKELISLIFRKIHTMKGGFGVFYMQNAVRYLHNVEDKLLEMAEDSGHITLSGLAGFCRGLRIQENVNLDLQVLQDSLNAYYFNLKNMVIMDRFKLMEAEDKMLKMLTPYECAELLPYIRQYKYRSLKDMLIGYSDCISQMAEKLEKPVLPLVFEGGNILVDGDKYGSFIKSLVHVFRNAVDHGIETPEDRIELGKNEYGKIRCAIELQEKYLAIRISDDGSGINTGLIRDKAIVKGIYSKEEAYSMTDEDVMQLIFRDDFSTRDSVTEFSGRGYGLSAVKSETEKLGGSIKVESIPGEGTSFNFIIPFENTEKVRKKVKVQDILTPLLSTAKDLIAAETGLDAVSGSEFQLDKSGCLKLEKHAVFTNLRGVVEGRLILDYDDKLANRIYREFSSGLTEIEEGSVFDEILLEFSNMITGNSTKLFEGFEDSIVLEKPYLIDAKESVVKYPSFYSWTCRLTFSEGNLNLSLILSDKAMEVIDIEQ